MAVDLQTHPRVGGIPVCISSVYQSPLLVGVVGGVQLEGEFCVPRRSIGLSKAFMVGAVGDQVGDRYPGLLTASQKYVGEKINIWCGMTDLIWVVCLVREGSKSVGLYAGIYGVLTYREIWTGMVSRRNFVV